ncbi:unnamed protein product [Cladocopium goreaui]|uniref:Uncharacterized protein n=1 Tax=Cladocopium goreaui TaxID=2562237 RepID=A0A9P1GGA9_9DINO|nr:unnamed protein product [Cladocopium goreaui]CAI3994700.1 unnamed protein product [Cladocopium goreaui]CAI4012460.1 unnamed protein product [Cladocopium goreaui]
MLRDGPSPIGRLPLRMLEGSVMSFAVGPMRTWALTSPKRCQVGSKHWRRTKS